MKTDRAEQHPGERPMPAATHDNEGGVLPGAAPSTSGTVSARRPSAMAAGSSPTGQLGDHPNMAGVSHAEMTSSEAPVSLARGPRQCLLRRLGPVDANNDPWVAIWLIHRCESFRHHHVSFVRASLSLDPTSEGRSTRMTRPPRVGRARVR